MGLALPNTVGNGLFLIQLAMPVRGGSRIFERGALFFRKVLRVTIATTDCKDAANTPDMKQ